MEMKLTHRRTLAVAAAAGLGVLGTTAGAASAAVTPVGATPADALTVTTAMSGAGLAVTGASFVTVPPNGTPNGVNSGPLGPYFPTTGNTFGILTTGNADFADDPNTSSRTAAFDGGGPVRGNTDRDVTILKVDLTVPAGANCLSFDFQFLSEEYPEWVGSSFNDAFIAELDNSNWTTSGSTISAPNNFAFDPTNNVISVNSTGATSFSTANSTGTTYDGATALLRAATPVTPGAHSVFFSIFDQGDADYDSAVFLDGLATGFAANPGAQCSPGATQQTYTVDVSPASDTNPVGTQHTVTATVNEAGSGPATTGNVLFTVSGVNPTGGTVPVNGSGQASFTYTGTNPGGDNITACYDQNGSGTCDSGEATASATKTWTSGGGTATCKGQAATITSSATRVQGTPGNDVIVGGPANQVINGNGGNDTLCGAGGNDVVNGGAGNDDIDGQGGMDIVIGGVGDDIEHGGDLNDKVGGEANDPGNDQLFGDAGPDQCYGTSADTFDVSCEQQG
jgi:Ca2+-binding RTX toxin-like protein